jgi:CelD/BcsL family acetyltransferase involved in cellulose biosynthesis
MKHADFNNKHESWAFSMRITEIGSYNDFISLKNEWKNVLDQTTNGVFSTWEWLSTWWRHFGENRTLLILLAEENDKILGIAPLMHSVYSTFGFRQGKIEFIGTPHSDYNDFILVDKHQECMKLFLVYLNNLSKNWSSLRLADIPEDGASISSMKGISHIVRPMHICPHLPLPISYDTLLEGLKSKRMREMRRSLRRIKEDGFKIDFVDHSDPHNVAKGMNTLFDLHQKRWRQKGISGLFSNQSFRGFHLEIAKLFSEKGWLGLYSLEISGVPVASLYGFKYASKYYAYIAGINPAYYAYSPGNLLLLHTMEICIKDKIADFDFMRGAESYKDRWTSIKKRNLEIIVLRHGSFFGFLYPLYRKLSFLRHLYSSSS